MSFDPQAALKFRLILVEGDFESEKKRMVDSIVQVAGLAEPDAFDRETIISNEKAFADWISSVCTTPFMADRRCVVVRNLYRVDPEDAAKSLNLHALTQLPESALLILVGDSEVSANQGSSPGKRDTKGAWRKEVQKAKGLILKSDVKESKKTLDLAAIARESGKRITPKAVQHLLEMTTNRVDRAQEELNKLILYVGDSPEITIEDMKRSVTPEPEHNIFNLMDACWRGDSKTALSQLERLRMLTRDFKDEAIPLLYTFSSSLRNLWQARGQIERMGSEFELEGKSFSKLAPYAQQKGLENAKKLSFDQILNCMEIVRHAHSQMTGQSLGVDAIEVIEQMILRICQVTSGRGLTHLG